MLAAGGESRVDNFRLGRCHLCFIGLCRRIGRRVFLWLVPLQPHNNRSGSSIPVCLGCRRRHRDEGAHHGRSSGHLSEGGEIILAVAEGKDNEGGKKVWCIHQ